MSKKGNRIDKHQANIRPRNPENYLKFEYNIAITNKELKICSKQE